MSDAPRLVVFCSLFPSGNQPMAGLFIRERMFRVGRHLPISVVVPMPWFPLQSLLRRWRPGFRPPAPAVEQQQSVTVYRPRFLSVPGWFKSLDGFFMALGAWPLLRRLRREGRLDILDAHFGYPDGYAATLLGRWLKVPVTITMRGTESRHARDPALGPLLARALQRATRVFSVSDSLRQVALAIGTPGERVRVVGNGVDIARFTPQPRAQARAALGLSEGAKVLVTVGGLVERKGFHRVIAAIPELMRDHPELVYLVVGGPSPEGDWTQKLHDQVAQLGLQQQVRFLGPLAPDHLSGPLSAADVFVLSTRNEGWANVLLEAMACGLPVVASDVGGNAEVVCRPALGTIVAFDDHAQLVQALREALSGAWDRQGIRAYAEDNTWDERVRVLLEEFRQIAAGGRA